RKIPAESPSAYRFGEFTLDLGQRQLSRAGVPVPLGRLTFDLLLALIEAAPNVLTHDQLIEKVWRGRSTSPETVTQRVKLLRDALGDAAERPRYVGLVRNQGYRLIAEVESLADGPVPPARPSIAWRPSRLAVAGVAALAAAAVLVLGVDRPAPIAAR